MSLTDAFGRTVTVSGNSYSVPGVTINAPNDTAALETLSAMAPPGWTPPAPTLSLADQAAALLAGGLTITSPTIPLAEVTFPTGGDAIDKYNSVQTYIMTHGGMIPGGGSSGLILDSAGGWHTVTTAQYTQIVSAIAVFVAECHLAMDGYPGATLPPTSVTIT